MANGLLTEITPGDGLHIEVAYALPARQALIRLLVPVGTTAGQAIELSEIAERFPQVDFDDARIGIFGRRATADTVLQEGDRVEIYRPLLADPKEVRRRLAAEGKTVKDRAKRRK